MLRKTYAFVCTLFALMFVFGFQSTSHASSVKASGAFLDTDNTAVALYIVGSDTFSGGQVSFTSGSGHYFANITGVSISSTNVALTASYTYAGFTTTITGTLSRPDTSSPWSVNYQVAVDGVTVATFSSTFRGSVTIR